MSSERSKTSWLKCGGPKRNGTIVEILQGLRASSRRHLAPPLIFLSFITIDAVIANQAFQNAR